MTQKIRDTPKSRRKATHYAGDQTPMGLKSTAKSTNHPRVVVVGDPETADSVAKELILVGIESKKLKYIKDVAPAVRTDDLGVIYVEPLNRTEILRAHSRLRKKRGLKDMPFFAIVPNGVSGRAERKMYREGIRMVFEWPREKQEFNQLFYSSIFSGTQEVRAEDTDEALLKAVKNRVVGRYGAFSPRVKYRVFSGIVLMRGTLPSQKYKQELIEMVQQTPGVRGTIEASLRVLDSQEPDKASMARKKLQQLEGVPTETLDIEVSRDQKYLTLVGTLPRRSMVTAAREPLKKMDGIKNVSSRIVVSKSMHKRDLRLAKRAQEIIKKHSESGSESLGITVTTGIAILKGQLETSHKLNKVVQDILELEGIRQVDSQI